MAAGLIKRSEKGGTFDFFRHRVMIPIFDLRGNVIAFSGRKLDPEQPGGKYVNSPETLVYKKSRTLFARAHCTSAVICSSVSGNSSTRAGPPI